MMKKPKESFQCKLKLQLQNGEEFEEVDESNSDTEFEKLPEEG